MQRHWKELRNLIWNSIFGILSVAKPVFLLCQYNFMTWDDLKNARDNSNDF